MAVTIKDFVYECAAYPYSKERYELMKECSELALMEQYIENKEFLEYNADDLREVMNFDESYFQESGDEYSYELIQESIASKAQDIYDKVKGGLKRIVKVVVTFFRKLVNSLSKTGQLAEDCLKGLRKLTLSEAAVDKIDKAVKDINALGDGDSDKDSKGAPAFRGVKAQPFASQLKLKYGHPHPFNSNIKGKKIFEDKLAVVLSNDQVILNAGTDAVAGDDLVDWLKRMLHNRRTPGDVAASIDSTLSTTSKYGVTISANSKNAKKILDELEKIQEQLNNSEVREKHPEDQLDTQAKGPKMVDKEGDAKGKEKNKGNYKMYADYTDAYAKINKCVGATISMYNRYVTGRSESLNSLKSTIDALAKVQLPAEQY